MSADMNVKLIAIVSSIVVAAGLGIAFIAIGSVGDDASQPESRAAVAGAAPTAATQRQVEDFSVACSVAETTGKNVCVVRQRLVEAETGRTVLVWSIGHGPRGDLLAVFHTPTGILLPNGLTLRIGDAAPRRIAFRTCDQGKCEAVLPLDDEVLAALKANGNSVGLSYITVGGRTVSRGLSLKGLDSAMASLPQG